MSRLRPRRNYSLILVRNETHVLLVGLTKTEVGRGKFTTFGTRVKDHESPEAAAARALAAGCGLKAGDMEKVGAIELEHENKIGIMHINVFVSKSYSGQMTEKAGLRPMWFPHESIPYGMMWPTYLYWLPLVVEGRHFHVNFLCDLDENVIFKDLRTLH